MCDLFLVVALHCVCLFCIFMRKNSRKINMVIGQTPMPATPINVNIFFVLKKVPAFLQFTVHARKTSKLRAAEFLAIGHQTKQIFFCVCVAKYNNCGSTHFPIPLVLYTAAGHCVFDKNGALFYLIWFDKS